MVDIDDDNKPAPENIPQPEEDADRVLGNEWGHDGFCYRRLNNLGDHHARMEIQVDATSSDYYLHLFEGLFPQQLINVVIGKVNNNIEGEPVTKGELIHWIGIWVLMSTVDGADQHSSWLTAEIDIFHGAPF